MARLTTKERDALPSRDFVFPKTRRYPIEDKEHAQKAVQLAGRDGGSVERKVDAAVHRRYPSIKISGKK
jgi:hypothetical protein